MRARNIKPGFFKNDLLSECSFESRLLFIGLWCFADRSGFFEYRPKKIKAELFPFENCEVEALLDELGKNGFLEMYLLPKKTEPVFIHIINFSRHQNPHKNEKKSEIKPIIESGKLEARYKHSTSMVQALYKHDSSIEKAQF